MDIYQLLLKKMKKKKKKNSIILDVINESKDKNYIKKERVYGRIQRQFYVGDVDSDDIKAEFKDGILKIVVPKEDKKIEKKQITIE